MVLDYGDNWWNQYDLDTQRGMATEMLAAGVDVKWFGDTGENPYAYIHSKVAVKDAESVWIRLRQLEILLSSSTVMPAGNRDWGVLVDDAGLADVVLNHLAFDENGAKDHITPVVASDAPSGWSMPSSTAIVGPTAHGDHGRFRSEPAGLSRQLHR